MDPPKDFMFVSDYSKSTYYHSSESFRLSNIYKNMQNSKTETVFMNTRCIGDTMQQTQSSNNNKMWKTKLVCDKVSLKDNTISTMITSDARH